GLARPERLLEAIHGASGAAKQHELVDYDGPHPDRSDQQSEHHGLDQPVRLPEQGKQRQVGGAQRQHRLRDIARVHASSPPRRSPTGPAPSPPTFPVPRKPPSPGPKCLRAPQKSAPPVTQKGLKKSQELQAARLRQRPENPVKLDQTRAPTGLTQPSQRYLG